MSQAVPDTRVARRAGIASFTGTTIEWYDFYIYSSASALVLNKVFFPTVDPAAGTLAAFATFWVGFLARPVGGVLFGHLGDRIGRKKTLITTLLLMGGATTCVGLLPTYATIGVAAPLLLVVLRMLQGVAMGGEWGGAVLIASEHAPKGRKILYGAFAQQGSPAGNVLATLSFLLVAQLPDEAFSSWGWRIPFLASALLVVVSLVIRLSVEESPEMRRLMESRTVAKLPIRDVLRSSPLIIALGVGACTIAVSATYFKSTFALSWAVSDLGFQRSTFLTVILVAGIAQLIFQPLGAVLATRWDLRRAVTVLLVPELVLMPAMFWLISTGSLGLSMLGMAVATLPHAMYYAALAGILARSFPAHVRYTGISLCYQLCTTLFAGTAPMLGQYLMNVTGSIVSVVFLAVAHVLLTLFCVLALLRRAPSTEGEPVAERPVVARSA
ncbi:MFS transporter [Saccharopolyspora erythraea NRRL 2338]|uniref:MFS transporter n=2 Tax=Saccharopolyspora erythraea TaxID=1836 RepID=A0ABN1DHP0_SACER|nr:MFS transporter [Saccharopolyspora erythraea]PFG96985.1 MFS transporter [Saccharopolyspora erythraea NRRL 2338]QRK87200.1 MHS family MFS transporter [Saccharopolyspora erythraea]CAM03281.1 metabolite transporter, MFS superfamily [Saccharopolyspora erythraea NRRL 2338]